ncbi:ATP-binding protein [Cytophaga hutchinsonii]|uniref:Uncharacterized protein n=1 Tax=Cytophaga hutchinsonii (strain ATCC 33406 / DSM 1761 / CIP 103989 / NBRC 15051 / NCIMB 9469 / D465) TaxID=269798 RepID=A0A6N4SV44_CYTH3|nr:ATP-binding protein [Cytophaga hutchinsonii]ABG60199.1 conserved hypothetical protein [Cytophaga hutchinsonii ATCC 33406]SFX22124.1 hypothetical protein SAMN04487930_102104 [Cytophaga hutchinsonii ATCC 33406]
MSLSSLNSAHQGYEYQDLLVAYFILKEIIEERDSSFFIDKKEYDGDTFDDLTIENNNGFFKKQVKYSNSSNSHTFEKKDLSSAAYQIALDKLFFSWNSHPNKSNCFLRLCLAWNEPIDDLTKILKEATEEKSFSNYNTKLFQIDIEEFWPLNGNPKSSWKRFNTQSPNINRADFNSFLNNFTIELECPKSSSDFYSAGELEKLVLNYVSQLGIGIFPNENKTKEEFALALIALVRKFRGTGKNITISYIFDYFSIKTDYGSIRQIFPINYSQNIEPNNFCKYILNKLEQHSKVILTGEPGSGKSWFIENFKKYLEEESINVIRHLCYTDLDDIHQKDRIKLDVFYGNLINDILDCFGELKHKKEKRYASTLSELNNLLSNITEKTILIVDGIDHIERIFQFKSYPDISKVDIDIINKINELKVSEHVKILISSQPISDLGLIKGFVSETMPKWEQLEVESYMSKLQLQDTALEENYSLSKFLFDKSKGSPLYLKYLTNEVKRLSSYSKEELNQLPEYSNNLKDYYCYLMSKLNLSAKLPRILSGVSFSLTKIELQEITGDGNYIDKSLVDLEPVLKLNVSQNGYIIYHESFRRFIVENLLSEGVDISSNIFKPIIEWFDKKGFYEYSKSFRFYFQFLYELNDVETISKYISKDFISKSVSFGHSWKSISNNYKYLLKSALQQKDFPKIILLNELNKTLSTTGDILDSHYETYLDALGHLRSFKYVSEHLSFDGAPTLPLQQGLAACYLCHSNGTSSPWEVYIDFFKEGESIEVELFGYYIRYLLICEDEKEILKIASQLQSDNLSSYCIIFRKEINSFSSNDFISKIKAESKDVNDILNSKNKIAQSGDFALLIDQIKKFRYVHNTELQTLNTFFHTVLTNKNNDTLINYISDSLKNLGWFYDWIIFSSKIKIAKTNNEISFNELKDIFLILKRETSPFKGQVRTCDLHILEKEIYFSIQEGLILLKKENEWSCIIDILIDVSNNTTTFYRKELSGPLDTNRLFQLLSENTNSENINKITDTFEAIIKEKQEYYLHSYIADYYFQLSKIYSLKKEIDTALQKFEKGIEYLLGYTSWKDSSVDDLTESIVDIYKIDNALGNEYIKKLKILIDSISNHTTGKGTSHFPVTWYDRFLEINPYDSALYLLNSLVTPIIDWRLEDSLQSLLISEENNDNINPLIKLFIAQTFPIETSESYLLNCIEIARKSKELNFELAKNFIAITSNKINQKSTEEYSIIFLDALKSVFEEFDLSSDFKNIKVRESNKHFAKDIDTNFDFKKDIIARKEFSEMPIEELTDFISENELTIKEVNSLLYHFDSINVEPNHFKQLVQSFFSQTHLYKSNAFDVGILFEKPNDMSIYYWTARYVYNFNGSYSSLSDIEAIKKAYNLGKEKSLEFLCELLSDKLNIQYRNALSANLLKGLIEVGFDSDKIKEAWLNAFNTIDYRLPSKDEFDWVKGLENELNLNIEEIFICILFCRFKAATTERTHATLSAIWYLLSCYPDKMIKPLKWFIKNRDNFLEANLLLVIELLYEYDKQDSNYKKHFVTEIEKIYPTNYLLIDMIIEKLHGKSKRTFLVNSNTIIYPSTLIKEEFLFFLKLNFRNYSIYKAGINLSNLFEKYRATFRNKYEDVLELYSNRVYKKMASHIHSSNYFLELVNKDLYRDIYKFKGEDIIVEDLKVNTSKLIAQFLSRTSRPVKLPLPSTLEKDFISLTVTDNQEWIRIGYYESELLEKSHGELQEYKVYGGINFAKELSNSIPLTISDLDGNEYIKEENESLTSIILQHDPLEEYKILWLSEDLFEFLELKICDIIEGLFARNSTNDVVLKYNYWSSDYINLGYSDSIECEIPKHEGAELLIRADYFKKICELYENIPHYITYRISPKDTDNYE